MWLNKDVRRKVTDADVHPERIILDAPVTRAIRKVSRDGAVTMGQSPAQAMKAAVERRVNL